MGERQAGAVLESQVSFELRALDACLEAQYGEAFRDADARTEAEKRAEELFIQQQLTEVDHLNRRRKANRHQQETLDGVHQNLKTAAKEASMPYAVSTVYHERRDGNYWWLDQDPLDVARSGYKFHKAEAARKRIPFEEAEAVDVRDNLKPGRIKIFFSPKMSTADARYEVARSENLADEDMIRIHMSDVDETTGEIRGKYMQSVLVRDIPLSAWVSMLRDPHNIFGRSFKVDDERSALSVLKLHHELELPEAALPEGVVTLIEAILPYLDNATRAKVTPRLEAYRSGQDELDSQAESIADRWLAFEVELADSLEAGAATADIRQFVFQLQNQWSRPMLQLLEAHNLPDGGLSMTRRLAAKLEEAKRNTLWTAAAVATDNEEVLQQLAPETARQIRESELLIRKHLDAGQGYAAVAALQATMNRLIAISNVHVGGGCPGKNRADFGGSTGRRKDSKNSLADFDPFEDSTEEDEESDVTPAWSWVSGYCRIKECPSSGLTEVGRCKVCRGCQYIFDRGKDPDAVYAARQTQARKTGLFLMDIISPSTSPAADQKVTTFAA